MKQLFKQTFILSASNVATRFMGMLFFVILARSLTVSEYGLFRYLITLSAIYSLAFIGVPTALAKFLGENNSDPELVSEYLGNSLALLLVLFLLTMIIVLLSAPSKLFLALFLFALGVDTVYLGFARGMLDYLKLNGFKLLENLIQLTILIIATSIYNNVDFTFSVVFYSLSGTVSLLVFEVIRPRLKLRLRYSRAIMTQLLKYAGSVTAGAIGWTLLFGISSIYVKQICSMEYVAYLSVGLTIMQVFTFLPDAINTIMMPKVANLEKKNKIINPLKIAAIISFLVSIIIAIFLYLFRNIIITYIFTDKYQPVLAIIIPLSLCHIFIAVHQVYSSAWQGLGKPGIPSISILIASGVNFILGYVLTKSYGIVGASYALAISAVASWIIIIVVWRRWVKRGGLEAVSVIEQAA